MHLLWQVAYIQPPRAGTLGAATIGQGGAGRIRDRLCATLRKVVARRAQRAGGIAGCDGHTQFAGQYVGVVGCVIGGPACVGRQSDETAGTIRD